MRQTANNLSPPLAMTEQVTPPFLRAYKLGADYAKATKELHHPSSQIQQSILLDLLGDDRTFLPALRYLIEQPRFSQLLSKQSPAICSMIKDGLLQETSAHFLPQVQRGINSFLNGFLGLDDTCMSIENLKDENNSALSISCVKRDTATGLDSNISLAAESPQSLKDPSGQEHRNTIERLSQALLSDIRNIRLYTERAIAYAAIQDWESCIADYTFALREQPLNMEIFFCRAKAHETNGSLHYARKDMQKAAELGKIQAKEWLNADILDRGAADELRRLEEQARINDNRTPYQRWVDQRVKLQEFVDKGDPDAQKWLNIHLQHGKYHLQCQVQKELGERNKQVAKQVKKGLEARKARVRFPFLLCQASFLVVILAVIVSHHFWIFVPIFLILFFFLDKFIWAPRTVISLQHLSRLKQATGELEEQLNLISKIDETT